MGGPADASHVPSPSASERGAWGLLCDAAALTVFAVGWVAVAGRWVGAAPPVELLVLVVPALVAGHLLADLISGLVHWFADEFFDEDTPLLGPLLIYGFRDHHRNPRDIVTHRFVSVCGYNALATLPVLAALLLWPATDGIGRAVHALLLATSLSVAITNQLHKWAHAERAPRWVRWLQRHGLILPPEHHARHHARGDRAYCVTAGWLNPALDALGLLPALGVSFHGIGRRLRGR